MVVLKGRKDMRGRGEGGVEKRQKLVSTWPRSTYRA